jgi:glutathione peroxidase
MPDTADALPYDEITLTTLEGAALPLREFAGRVLLVVNVASRCGHTPQYEGLEALHRRFHDAGLTVLGFPCDQFGHQEPGDAADIRTFCSTTYDVTFPILAKTDVNGPRTHPLWRQLKRARRGVLGTESIKWNFTKFLVGRDGTVRERVAPGVLPEQLAPEIERLLAEPAGR